jgi:prepilin-type N-terminal cleavage/methylation domain-containing protein
MGLNEKTPARAAFTLIELLVVITVIAILMALLFPAFKGVQDQAKRTQAKNDVTQIVTAVNAFYTEYGRYPIDTVAHPNMDVLYGDPGGSADNSEVMAPLRASDDTLNPKKISFLQVNDAKDGDHPRGGIATKDITQNGWTIKIGAIVDPWGGEYLISVDGTYDDSLDPAYSDMANPVKTGSIAWSFGKDAKKGTNDDGKYKDSDDVISWQ